MKIGEKYEYQKKRNLLHSHAVSTRSCMRKSLFTKYCTSLTCLFPITLHGSLSKFCLKKKHPHHVDTNRSVSPFLSPDLQGCRVGQYGDQLRMRTDGSIVYMQMENHFLLVLFVMFPGCVFINFSPLAVQSHQQT